MKRRLINSHTVFIATLIVVASLTLIIYFTGLEDHRSLYLNSLFSPTLLSTAFLSFVTTGLYNGWKLKDNIVNPLNKFNRWKKPDLLADDGSLMIIDPPGDEGVEGCLVSIVSWIVIGIFGTIISWMSGTFFWGVILTFAGLLYWIIFRAYRLIFKNSPTCKGNFWKIPGIAILFTIFFNCWIYPIIFTTHFIRKK